MGITIKDLAAWKAAGTRFVMLTAYDYPTARLLAEAEIPVLLVGDTLADNVLGYPNTIPVTMTEMLHHARAVARGAPDQLLVGDLPFGAYQRSCGDAIDSSIQYLKAGMHAVKLEGGVQSVNIPIDAVIMPKNAKARDLPIFFEAKSAGDFTNTNKRRKEEAMKMGQLRSTYGKKIKFNLFLCGYFDSGYLGYEAAEGIDWVWEHRIDDLALFGI